VLYDPDTTQLYGLTASQVLDAGMRLMSAAPGEDEVAIDAGTPLTHLQRSREAPCAALVAAVPLIDLALDDQIFLFQAANGELALSVGPKIIEDPWTMIGEMVAVTTHTGAMRLAEVISADGRFSMPNPTDGLDTNFHHAIKLRTPDGSQLVGPGDAGGLVSTLSGDWLGIVVAGGGDTAFAAPLFPTVERLNLAALTHSKVLNYNHGSGDLHVDYSERKLVPMDSFPDVNPDTATPQNISDEIKYVLFTDRENAAGQETKA
jgi:hypothetical protein